jgi:hypothetical protein
VGDPGLLSFEPADEAEEKTISYVIPLKREIQKKFTPLSRKQSPEVLLGIETASRRNNE